MRPALSLALERRLGPTAARLVRALPQPWRATARRRRFLCLAACTPGFAAVAALPLHKNVWLLLGGTLAVLAVAAIRSLSEPRLISGGSHD
jgi:hypothetical protein